MTDSYLAGLWSRAAAGYEQSGVEFFGPLGQELVTRAGLRPGDRVLDVGTGRGHVLFPAAAAVGPDGTVQGIDLADEMVRLTAAEIAERGVTNASVRVGDAAEPGLPDGNVDVVLAGFMMFLLPGPAAALRAYRKALTTPGRLAFSTYGPSDEHLLAARAILRSLAGTRRLSDDVFDDPDSMAAMVRDAGFEDVAITDVTVRTRFADAGQWWQWAWSVGIRASLERIGPERLERARPEIEDALSGWRQPDGSLLMPTEVRYTVASA